MRVLKFLSGIVGAIVMGLIILTLGSVVASMECWRRDEWIWKDFL